MYSRSTNVGIPTLQGSSSASALNKKRPWRVLIADDDHEVHAVTKLTLADIVIEGRGIEFLSTYSAKETIETLRQEQDIAVVLLDVVMESEDVLPTE